VNIEVRAPARPALNPFYRPEHEAFRETVRRFVKKEIEPFATQWDEAEEFRASFIARRRQSACCSSVSPRHMAASPATASCGSSLAKDSRVAAPTAFARP
jgi:alkylation response protein AidB-like acyl-CoA dehydrogenase